MVRRRRVMLSLTLLIVITGAFAFWTVIAGPDVPCPCKDADRRLEDRPDGTGSAAVTFHVPRGTDHLRIAAAYELDGRATITIRHVDEWDRGPHNNDHVERITGQNMLHNHQWLVIRNPPAGEWGLYVNYKAEGAFAFGIYF